MPSAVALYSCTAGLHLSCLALGLGKGDEVITTPMTFAATVNAIIHSGATPVLADIDPVSWNIDPLEIEKKITPHTKAIMPVHFAGRSCDMDAIMEIAKRNNLYVIEDCAHAIETEYHGKKAGTFGDFGVFSFYSTKNIATGEGGMVIGEDGEKMAHIKMLGLHGMSHDAWKRFSDEGYKHYFVEEAGFKYNMMDLQAAIGIHQLPRIEKYNKKREVIWNKYIKAFKDLPIGLPAPVEQNTRHAYHLFTITINEEKCGMDRDSFLTKMAKNNIGVGVHYLSIPEHPYYKREFGWEPNDYPNAMKYGRETVSIPLSAKLTDEDVEDLIEAFEIEKKFHELILIEKAKSERIALYQQLYSTVHPIYQRNLTKVHIPNEIKSRKAFLFKKELQNKSILEVGCGQGAFLISCAKFINKRELCGLDVTIPSSEICELYPQINFIIADITEFKLNQKYDVIYSNHVLEHMATDDLHTHLESLEEALIAGGTLIINMPNRLFGPSDVTRIIDFSYTGKTQALGSHFNELTYNELISLLKSYGFYNFKTVFPHTKLRHIFRSFRMNPSILCKIEKSKFLMKILHSIKFKGTCIAKFEISIICHKKSE